VLPESDADLRFVDGQTGDEIYVAIRARQDQIALTLSLRNDGDIEVVLNSLDCEQLVAKLQHALLHVSIAPQ